MSELVSSSCNDLRDDGRVGLDSKKGIRGKHHLGFFVVLIDPNLDDGQEPTAFLLTVFDAPLDLGPDLWGQMRVVTGCVGHPAAFCCH